MCAMLYKLYKFTAQHLRSFYAKYFAGLLRLKHILADLKDNIVIKLYIRKELVSTENESQCQSMEHKMLLNVRENI